MEILLPGLRILIIHEQGLEPGKADNSSFSPTFCQPKPINCQVLAVTKNDTVAD